MRIFLGSDHGGFELKEALKDWLKEKKYEVNDMGAPRLEPEDDFVDYAMAVAEMLQLEPEARGIVLCRNGVGVDVVANRYAGVRCALGFDKKQVEKARNDDDINCLALPADYLEPKEARELVELFLKTKFSHEARFKRRLVKLEKIGRGCC